jgi:hypothetical protein
MRKKLILPAAVMVVAVPSLLLGVIYMAQAVLLVLLIVFCAVLWNGISAAWRERRAQRHWTGDHPERSSS